MTDTIIQEIEDQLKDQSSKIKIIKSKIFNRIEATKNRTGPSLKAKIALWKSTTQKNSKHFENILDRLKELSNRPTIVSGGRNNKKTKLRKRRVKQGRKAFLSRKVKKRF
jgi:hypothetical protein